MGYTNGYALFAGVGESGLNKLIHQVYATRPNYFHFATPTLGGGTHNFGLLSPLSIPGTSVTLDYRVELSLPVLDFYPQTTPLPAPLVLGPDQFSLTAGARICVVCSPPRLTASDNDRQNTGELVCTRISAACTGSPVAVPLGGGDALLGLEVSDIHVEGIGDLEKPVECIAKLVLGVLLRKLQYSLQHHNLGIVTISLADGPKIADNQLQVWAKLS